MVDLEKQGRVAVLTINRPDARNAVNGAVATGMEAAIDDVEADDGIWCSILTGNGPVFSAGADLKEIASGNAAALQTERGGFAGIARRERRKPIIAAVDGPALAGGTEIVLSCDLVVASTNARFGIPEVKRCLIAAAGGLLRLPQALPRNIAMELAITGDPIDAEAAHRFGLVNVLCDPGEALDKARELAKRVTANAPLAVYASREVVLEGLKNGEEAGWAATGRQFAALFSTEDFAEGPRAFIEKREPQWKGR